MRHPLNGIIKYSNFIKLEHSLFALPFGIASYFLILNKIEFSLYTFTFLILSMISIRAYGMAINRIIDKKIDALNPRTKKRELVTGEISINSAVILTIISLLIFFITLTQFNIRALWLSPIVILVFTIYPFTKRITYLCHFFLGLVYLIVPPAIEIAVTGAISLETLVLGISGFFWVSGFDIIYAILDVDFDKKENIYSIPSKFGISNSIKLAWICHFFTLLGIGSLGIIQELGPIYWVGCTILLALFGREHMIIMTINKKNVEKAFFDMNWIISFTLMILIIITSTI